MKTNHSDICLQSQHGSVLLEALIAILIFSIGILGLVGMQSTAINTSSDAKYRSSAGFLVDQMIGTVWASRLPASNNVASNVLAAVPDAWLACNPCSAASANPKIATWVNAVAAALPNAVASITINGSLVSVAVSWTPPNVPAATPPHTHTAVTYIN